MQMEIIARHFTLGEEQREEIESSLEKLERFSPRPVQNIKITLVHEAGMFSADAALFLKNNEFRAKAEGAEPEFAVNDLVENLRVQLSKFKGKISGKQKGEEGGLGRAMLADGPLGSGDSRPEGFVLRDMDVESAKEAFLAGSLPFLVFRNIETSGVGVIYRNEDGGIAHMEAVGA
ncbi:MAG: HPF/RaiA family ribosome-associated protein [bacterium]|nr:HPF/RaiA family ribosome-associated protein [bacterium]